MYITFIMIIIENKFEFILKNKTFDHNILDGNNTKSTAFQKQIIQSLKLKLIVMSLK